MKGDRELMGGFLDRYFRIRENGSTPGTEAVAGLTTFLTMCYILFVQPAMLSDAGMDAGAVFTATCLASALASIMMGVFRLPRHGDSVAEGPRGHFHLRNSFCHPLHGGIP